jgi:hypothetical protein
MGGASAWTKQNQTSGEFMVLKKRGTNHERRKIHARPAEKI